MNWKVASAKQRFSEIVRKAAQAPQLVYNRDRMVAAVIDAATFQEFQAWRAAREQRSIADAFEELRRMLPAGERSLRRTTRRERRNTFVDALDELSR